MKWLCYPNNNEFLFVEDRPEVPFQPIFNFSLARNSVVIEQNAISAYVERQLLSAFG